MWLGLALVVWLWGVALYLALYYFAGWYWHGRLYEVLGQSFYNAHIPGGGWAATIVPTIVFLTTLGIVGAARRPIGAAARWISRRMPVPQRAGVVACHLALIGIAAPAVHAGVVGTRNGIDAAISRAQLQAAMKQAAEQRARDPFYNGAGLTEPVAYVSAGSMWNERLILGTNGQFRRSTGACMGGDGLEGRFVRVGDQLQFDPPPPDFEPFADPLSRLREVRWGQRLYLIADEREALLDFCNAVNAGSNGRAVGMGKVLLREGDEMVPVTGLPALPSEFAEYLLASPLVGRTTEMAADGTTWVDIGSDQGLRLGMILFVPDSPAGGEWHDTFGGGRRTQPLQILEVEPTRCRVRYRYAPDRKPPLPVGLTVTSNNA